MASTLVIRHQIGDYDVWRSAFDRDASDRREHGCTQETVFRAVDDPTTILVAMEYSSRDAALGFLGNPVLKAAGGRGVFREGCLSLPDFTANVPRATQARPMEKGSKELAE